MADRTVKVSLVLAAQGYMSGMDAVAQKTAQTGTEIEKLNQKRQAFTSLGTAAMGFGATAAAGVALAISRFAEFDQQMSYVQAATHETASNMNLLRDAALEAGARTVYSATEAAGAIEELAKAGVSTADILSGGLDASLDLAAAGGLAVADAAGIAATALKTFNLRGEDMSHVADLLAAGAGKAMGDVSELSQALAQGGLVAKATGLSIEETTAGLAAFAAEGLRGSDAGTSFKSMLQRLTPQSAEAQRAMDELGISAYDANGQFIGLAEFAGVLQRSLRDLTPEQRNSAMATIFGADAVRAANVIYEQGAAGIREWTEAVDDQGYAAETARMRLDNLKGDVEALGGAFDTALIQSGSGANDALRGLVQIVTGAVGAFSELPGPVQESAVYFGLAAAAVGLVGGAALVAIPRIAEFKATVSAAGFSLKGLSLAAAGVTVGLTAVIGIVAAVASAQADARAKAQAYADTLDEGTQRVTRSTREMAKTALAAKTSFLLFEQDSAYDAAAKLGLGLDLITDAALGNVKALDEVSAAIQRAYAEGETVTTQATADRANAAKVLEDAIRGENSSLESAIEVARQKQDADKEGSVASLESADASKSAASAYMDTASAAGGLTNELTQLIDVINEANGVNQDAISANAQWQEALAGIASGVDDQKRAYEEANGSLSGFNLSLDQNTLAGSQNAASLSEVAAAAQDAAAKQFEQDKATMSAKDAADKYNSTLGAQRQAFIDSAIQAGYNAEAVHGLADQVFRLPSSKQVDIIAETAAAEQRLQEFQNKQRLIRVGVEMYGQNSYQIAGTSVRFNAAGNYYEGGKPKAFAAGGFASGIYPATSGGIHKFAEAGFDEAYITMDPAYRDRSMSIWSEVGRQLGAWESPGPMRGDAWQPAAPSYGPPAGSAVTASGDSYTFNGQFAMTAEQIADQIATKKRRQMARSGALRASGVR